MKKIKISKHEVYDIFNTFGVTEEILQSNSVEEKNKLIQDYVRLLSNLYNTIEKHLEEY